ncbi:MAG: glycosyltransferase family 2 protein [Desulfurococcales archaeon]|nr:glycosyltransferase family 2 protein [Desulfurococcales archaeon]
MASYLDLEIEAWKRLAPGAAYTIIEALYIVSILVLSAYALWYLSSLVAYLARPGLPSREPEGGWPRVAVVYPVYNDYEILSSLRTALAMDYPDYTVIVVDDSSDARLSGRLEEEARRSGGRLVHLKRPNRRGLKAGALNYAARHAERLGAKYILVLDADFEPPPWLLRRMVSIAESSGAVIVQGHQKHSKGASGFFGALYRASMAGATVFLAGREAMGMFPIFTGSVALIRLDALREVGFREGSISEDLRWTIDARLAGVLDAVRVDPHSWAAGSVPKSLRAVVRQQLRWSAGTTRETLSTMRDFLLARHVSPGEKAGYLLQGMFYTQGVWVYLSTLAPLLASLLGYTLPPLWGLGLYVWMLGIETIVLAGAMEEGYARGLMAQVALAVLPYIYITSLIHAVGTLQALLGRGGSWVVTPKRGEYEGLYRD